MRALFCCAVALVVTAVPIGAQVCAGFAPFATRYRVGGSAEFTDGVQAFGGDIGAASAAGGFGSVGVAAITYDDMDGTTLDLSASGGWQVPLGAARTVEMCPLAQFSYGIGPNDIEGTNVDLRTISYAIGAAIGAAIAASPTVQLVPSGGLAFAYAKATFEGDAAGDLDVSDTFGIASLGLGIVMNRTFAIQPGVSIPFGVDESDPVWSIGFALFLGNR